jgi:hypothetical protein
MSHEPSLTGASPIPDFRTTIGCLLPSSYIGHGPLHDLKALPVIIPMSRRFFMGYAVFTVAANKLLPTLGLRLASQVDGVMQVLMIQNLHRLSRMGLFYISCSCMRCILLFKLRHNAADSPSIFLSSYVQDCALNVTRNFLKASKLYM